MNRYQIWQQQIEEHLLKTAKNKRSKQLLKKGMAKRIALIRMSLALGCSVKQVEKRLNPAERIGKPKKPKVKR